MRIVLVVHQFPPFHHGGTEVLALETARHLRLRGHDVHVFTAEPDDNGPGDSSAIESDTYEDIPVHRIRRRKERGIDRFRSHYNNATILAASRRLFRRLRPDVVHVFHLYRLSTSVVDAARECGARTVFTATDFWTICPTSLLRRHDDSMCNGPNRGQGDCLKCLAARAPATVRRVLQHSPGWMVSGVAAMSWTPLLGMSKKVRMLRSFLSRQRYMRAVLQTCDAIIAPTRIMRQMLVGNGVSPEKVVRIGYGLNHADVNRQPDQNLGKGVRLGYIGQLSDHKGPHILLEAYRLLKDQPRPAGLHLWGDPGQNPEYAARLHDLAAGQPNVRFRGTFPNRDVWDVLAEIDVLIVPSLWYENAPLVVLSAFAARTPVIAADVPGISEIVEHDRSGLLFRRGDVPALAEQLRRIVSEEALLDRLRAGIPAVKTMMEQATELEDLYFRLLGGNAVAMHHADGALSISQT